VKPAIDTTFAMSDIAAAFDRLEGGAHFGKVSLVA